MADSTITIEGNLTADPELHYADSGVPYCRMRVAVSHSKKVGNDWVEETSFLSGTCFNKLAENAAETLTKGDRVLLYGQIRQRTVEQDDGTKREYVGINIDGIGPSLRWATATVIRNPKAEGGGKAAPKGGGDDFFGDDGSDF